MKYKEIPRALWKTIMYYRVRGYTNTEIAKEADCDRKTVAIHLKKLRLMEQKEFDKIFRFLFNSESIPIWGKKK